MSFQHDGAESLVVYATDDSLRSHILSVLESSIGPCPSMVTRWSDLENLLSSKPVSVLLLAVSQVAGKINISPEEEFDSLIKFLPRLHQQHPACQVILISAEKIPMPQMCQVVSQGIAGFINYQQTDFAEQLLEQVRSAQRHYLEQKSLEQGAQSANHTADYHGLVGTSTALIRVVRQAQRAAGVSDAPVTIYGESGTGKQLIAETIHKLDTKRKQHNFVCVNCAAIVGTLAESELFGHRKGAFTGATKDRLGYFRAADGGTILLDEISELPQAIQPKILRVLQEGLVMPVGSDREYRIDVRVIASTNRNLHEMVEQGLFRLDLFQRLNVIELTVPSLRQRPEDIPALFESFLRKYAHYYPDRIKTVDPQVYEFMAKAVGTGNIRELENIVRRILVFKEHGNRIEVTDLPPELLKVSQVQKKLSGQPEIHPETLDALISGSRALADAMDEYEKFLLTRLMDRGLNRSVLAQRLGVTRRTLYNKLQKYDLD